MNRFAVLADDVVESVVDAFEFNLTRESSEPWNTDSSDVSDFAERFFFFETELM